MGSSRVLRGHRVEWDRTGFETGIAFGFEAPKRSNADPGGRGKLFLREVPRDTETLEPPADLHQHLAWREGSYTGYFCPVIAQLQI